MSKKVEYCENSTITEAWAAVLGSPAEINDSVTGGLENNASKVLGEFSIKPSRVFIEQNADEKLVPSFWHKQLTWNNSKYLARIGHRYLSVHFIKTEDKYEKYKNSLLPQIREWLNAYKETIDGRKEKHSVDRVIFGYVNNFRFEVDQSFDLKKYFKILFGTEAKSAKNGISHLNVNFRLQHESIEVAVDLNIMPHPTNKSQLMVSTKIEGQKSIGEDLTFEEPDKIIENIFVTKEAAKAVFFDLATDETMKLMGAIYDN